MAKKAETPTVEAPAAGREPNMPLVSWTYYDVTLMLTSPFAASIPKNVDEIAAMLANRAMTEAEYKKAVARGETPEPLADLVEGVAGEVDATSEEERGWATFKKDEKGLYYEARCIKAHLKDAALVLQPVFKDKLGLTAVKAKLANYVYVEPDRIYIGGVDGQIKQKPDGTETRFVHVMTMQGPRNTVKNVDYVVDARLAFALRVLDVSFVTQDILIALFDYGAVHGIGQERSQDFGRYFWTLRRRE